MGILTDIENTLNTSDKATYKVLYEKHLRYLPLFSDCYVSVGKNYPYFHIWDASHPIYIRFDSYHNRPYDCVNVKCPYMIYDWYNKEKDAYVIPSWVNFKVNYGASRKHPETNRVLLKVNTRSEFYKKVIFEDGINDSTKQFENCKIEIVEYQ